MAKKLALLATGFFLFFFAVNAHASFITNGDFNVPAGSHLNEFYEVTGVMADGWTTSFSPDIFDQNTNFRGFQWGPSNSGGSFLHGLQNGWWKEKVSQEISGLIVGRQYQLTFEQSISRYMEPSSPSEAGGNWVITFGTETQSSDFMDFPPGLYDYTFPGWDWQTMIFTATAETQLLTFTATSAAYADRADLGLDGVSLTMAATPIPPSLFLFGSGAALLLPMARRRRT